MIVEMLADKKISSNMTDSSQLNKKKKVTLRASKQGIVTAEKALIGLDFESKSIFAASQLISRSTVTKFFQGEPIQLDSFKRICDALNLKSWQEIAGISPAAENCSSRIDPDKEEVGKMLTLRRRVTVVDRNSEKVKAVITLEGDVDSVDNWEFIQLVLRKYSGSSINIIDIESGSIRLTVEGSPADIQKLIDKIRSGELPEINRLPVQNIEISTENLDTQKIDKWDLVKTIVDRRITNQNLSDADLSDADLSDADLSDADLSRADLSDADLSRADLSDADLSRADLSGADLSRADLSRAILMGANLSGADLRANLSDATLSDADLSGAILSGAILSGAILRSAYLNRADLMGADLRGADLSGAILMCAYLNRADLRGDDLRGASLRGANLRGASLRGANLRGADLRGADLSDANLSDANLNFANLSGAGVEKTRFGDNQGISESMKLDLQQRGAIFEDAPGDRSKTYALK